MPTKRILLVEDSDDDVLFFRMAMRDCGYEIALVNKEDGEKAIEYLASIQHTANTLDSQIPDLIFLDIKMPKMDGFEVLKWLHQQLQYSTVPVIMFSSSDLPQDVRHALMAGANSYICKAGSLKVQRERMKILMKYWFDVHCCPGW